jgi:diguanylate cyclase (GGDEF)-like protein
MPLHDLSILFVVAVAATVNGVVLAWAATMTPRREPAVLWAVGSFLLALSAASVFLVPDPASAWRAPAFNIPALFSHAFLLAGVLRFCDRPAYWAPLGGLLGASLLLTLWLSLIEPDRDLRVFSAAIVGAFLRLTAALVLLLSRGTHHRGVAAVVAGALGLEGVLLIDHALAGLRGLVPVIGTDDALSRWPTWLARMFTATVSTPLLMLLGLSQLMGELRESANNDTLTGLSNRRGFFLRTGPLLAQGQRLKQLGSVLMLDIDRFKSLNDRFGHAVGDAVLRAMGATLGSVLRGSDTAVRWGGEEFCVLLPGTDGAGAHVGAERIRAEFARRCKAIPELAKENVSASIGIAYGHWHKVDFDTLQRQADAALYAAKNGGRDRAVLAEARN